MPAQALAAVATLLAFAPHDNRIEFLLDRGSAELVWIGPSTFRFRRTLEGPLPAAARAERERVPVEIDDTPGAVRLRTRFIEVAVQKHGLLVRVRRLDGEPLLADLSEPQAEGAGVAWEREAPAGVRFYGLGPRADPAFDLRGKAVTTEVPFLLSTAGFAEYHAGGGEFRMDFTAADRYRIRAPRVDYFFYYGPAPKQIFEEHNAVRGPARDWPAAAEGAGTWATLRTSLLRLVQGAMSAAFEPVFDLAPYANAPPDLLRRARQLGSLVPRVTAGTVGLSGFRGQLAGFFDIYDVEVRDRGHPVWHPLPFQFPDDVECARHADEFMLGDEMLIAPVYEPANQRTLYLPQGMWTNLETNEVSPGKRSITVDSAALAVFARNGTIVPLNSGEALGLHYFPRLAAEFFLLERDAGEYTQVHAAPAADIMRLEIESQKERAYQWVVHHVEKPAEVGFEDRKYGQAEGLAALADGTWFYDAAQKNLHIRARVKAGEDCIINVAW
ncbi:MAG: hypothetical protein LAP87_24960 [Acidobacteriia bacterium]|nr:hypothetical protein [Terriglobia bacterium]